MSQNGTFGDHITLQAASDLYNVEFQVLSSNGTGYTTTISPIVANPLCTFTLGHFAENDGEHYVCLAEEYKSSERNIEAECFADLQSDPSLVVGAPLSYDATQETDQGGEEERNEENDEHTCDKEPNPGKDDHERGNGLNPGNGDHASENRPNPGDGVRACQKSHTLETAIIRVRTGHNLKTMMMRVKTGNTLKTVIMRMIRGLIPLTNQTLSHHQQGRI